MAASELDGTDRPNPVSHLGGILFVHVKEMGHDRFHNWLAAVIRLHGDNAAEDLEQTAIPVFEDVVMGRETRIDEGAQILADGLASMPISNTKVTDSVFGKAIESFTEGLVINFLPESQ